MSVESFINSAARMPRLCIVDLDKTVWDSFSASATEPPYVRVLLRGGSGRGKLEHRCGGMPAQRFLAECGRSACLT
jgi:hypothetical protein